MFNPFYLTATTYAYLVRINILTTIHIMEFKVSMHGSTCELHRNLFPSYL